MHGIAMQRSSETLEYSQTTSLHQYPLHKIDSKLLVFVALLLVTVAMRNKLHNAGAVAFS